MLEHLGRDVVYIVSLDGRVLAFAMIVTLVTAAIFRLPPALRGSAVSVNDGLKDASQTERGGSSSRFSPHSRRWRWRWRRWDCTA
jgi:hypothetical protein